MSHPRSTYLELQWRIDAPPTLHPGPFLILFLNRFL